MTPETSAKTMAIHRLPIYNSSRLTDPEVIATFAARQLLLERLLGDLHAEKPSSRAQHHLLVGQRGMGKTLLLARVAAELRTSSLREKFVPLVFAEEQYAVDRLSKFWLNCLDSLADEQDRQGHKAQVDRIDDAVWGLSNRLVGSDNDTLLAQEALEAFLRLAGETRRRPVLLVDNLQLVFERISSEEQHRLREVLMRPGCPILVGASPSPPPESQNYGAAFYDHFKVHYLRPLDVQEMQRVLLHLADIVGDQTIHHRVQNNLDRLAVLRQLTGGNPRTTVTLFLLYAEDFSPSVFSDLENLLDRATPLYKAQFEELSPQQQVIASAIADHWDPVTNRTIADNTGLAPTKISPQLDRMERTGFLERVELFGNASTGYQLAERFFNIWFLMRSASRRQRRQVEFLTRFLQSFYESHERDRLARHLMAEHRFSSDRYLLSCAVAESLENHLTGEELKRYAQLKVLSERDREARRQLEKILDLSSLPSATLAFDQLRQKLMALVPPNSPITPEAFAEKVLGDRHMFSDGTRERLAARQEQLTAEEISETLETIESSHQITTEIYGEQASTWFSDRLSKGQLRSSRDEEDWDRAFLIAQTRESIKLMMDILPVRFGRQISDQAVSHISRYLLPSADDAEDWFRWGFVLHIKLERHEEAEKAYRKALHFSPDSATIWALLGDLLLEGLHRHKDAEVAYRKALDINPKLDIAWSGLGDLFHHGLKIYEKAEVAYRKALEINSQHAASWAELGNLLYHHLQRYEEAEVAYHKAIYNDPEYDFLQICLSDLLHYHLKRYEEAETAYHRAIELDPDYIWSWIGLGNLLQDHLSRFEEADAAYVEAIELDPTEESAYQDLIFLRRDCFGEGLGARRYLEQLPKSTNTILVALHQTLFHAYEANWDLANKFLSNALRNLKDDFSAYTGVSWIRASAVLLHLNYGEQLLVLLRERGDNERLRPWYEALSALQLGDRRYLQNVAPEIRTTAENLYSDIEHYLNHLPESTRRRPLPSAPKKTRRTKKS